MGKTISPQMILRFEHHLKENERSKTTICKYLHDVAEFKLFSDNRAIDKNIVLAYKAELLKKICRFKRKFDAGRSEFLFSFYALGKSDRKAFSDTEKSVLLRGKGTIPSGLLQSFENRV